MKQLQELQCNCSTETWNQAHRILQVHTERTKRRKKTTGNIFGIHDVAKIYRGITRVGVTRGSNWWVMGHPIFFDKKSDNLFSRCFWKWWPLFSAVVSSPLTPIFPRRLYSVLSKFSHNKLILGRVLPPWRMSSGAVRHPPPSDTTANISCQLAANNLWHQSWQNWCYSNQQQIQPIQVTQLNIKATSGTARHWHYEWWICNRHINSS